MRSGIHFACYKCRKPITEWTATVRPDGRLSLVASCHGETEERIVILDMAGIMFSGLDPREMQERDPERWLEHAADSLP